MCWQLKFVLVIYYLINTSRTQKIQILKKTATTKKQKKKRCILFKLDAFLITFNDSLSNYLAINNLSNALTCQQLKNTIFQKNSCVFIKSLSLLIITSDNPWCIYLVINFLIKKLKKKTNIRKKIVLFFKP